MMGIELCDLKNKIINADPAKIKAKDSYFQLKTIAKNTGHAALFNTKKQLNPRKEPIPTNHQMQHHFLRQTKVLTCEPHRVCNHCAFCFSQSLSALARSLVTRPGDGGDRL